VVLSGWRRDTRLHSGGRDDLIVSQVQTHPTPRAAAQGTSQIPEKEV
jgi:hypothetical protein